MSQHGYPLAIRPTSSVEMDQFDPYDDANGTSIQKQRDTTQAPKTGLLSTLKTIYFTISGMLGFGERFSLLFCEFSPILTRSSVPAYAVCGLKKSSFLGAPCLVFALLESS